MKQWLNKNRWKALLSSVVLLLPMLVGLLFWKRLSVARGFVVCGLPLLLLGLHWFCLLFTAADPKNKGQHPKAMGLIFWMLPLLSLGIYAFWYSVAFGREIDMEFLMPLLFSIVFIVFGNTLPKIRQNATLGIKVYWVLRDEENWNHTHRFAGKLWVAGGLLLLASLLFPGEYYLPVMLMDLLVLALAPILYSWNFARTHKAPARTAPQQSSKLTRRAGLGGTLLGIGILGFVLVMLFTGSIHYNLEEDQFTIEASYYQDLTIPYQDIERLELRHSDEAGSRTMGFGSPVLSLGSFQNEEFGTYTRYTYTGQQSCIVIQSDGRILVLGDKSPEETKALYEGLLEKTN